MSMQALNHLVARSIVDPSVVQAFNGGRIGDVISELGFSRQLRSRLAQLPAETFAEYAILAYREVKADEEIRQANRLPSPAEGLLPKARRSDKEQVA